MLVAIKKFIPGFKTVLVGLILTSVGFLETIEWTNLVPAGYEGIAMAITGMVVIALRAVTNTPLFKSD